VVNRALLEGRFFFTSREERPTYTPEDKQDSNCDEVRPDFSEHVQHLVDAC